MELKHTCKRTKMLFLYLTSCVIFLSCIVNWARSAPLDCSKSPCHNGGKCKENSPICDCPPRFSGSLCETRRGCPRDLEQYQVLGICIGYVMPWTNRTTAGSVCKKGGAKLVDLSSPLKFIATAIHVQGYIHTGFWVDATFSNGIWTWADGTVIDSSTFTDDISTGQEKCLVLSYDSKYYIVDCDRKFLALCEADWIDPKA